MAYQERSVATQDRYLEASGSIGGELVDSVLEGVPSEIDYLFEVKYFIDELDLEPIREAIQALGRAVGNANSAGRQAVGLMLIVLGNRSEDEISATAERTRTHQVVRHLSVIGQDVSADVRITVLTEDRLERMTPQELRFRLLASPHVATELTRLTS